MPVGDLPILEIVIRQLAAHGFRNLNITIGYLGEMIRLICGDGSKWGVRIQYFAEDKPLGTMGPLLRVPGLDQPFLVMNGDLLTDFDYAAFYRWHLAHGTHLSIGTFMKPVTISLGVLQTDDNGKVVGFAEKPTHHFPCSMGVYCMNPELLRLIPKGPAVRLRRFDAPDLAAGTGGAGVPVPPHLDGHRSTGRFSRQRASCSRRNHCVSCRRRG